MNARLEAQECDDNEVVKRHGLTQIYIHYGYEDWCSLAPPIQLATPASELARFSIHLAVGASPKSMCIMTLGRLSKQIRLVSSCT